MLTIFMLQRKTIKCELFQTFWGYNFPSRSGDAKIRTLKVPKTAIEVHHQMANGSTEGYPRGTSTNLLEFGSLRVYGKCGKDEHIWICLETWTT